jgi:Rps23 Pro-64 3,4-dihydroxylase Tpa1-like proline 4-hydroxylase
MKILNIINQKKLLEKLESHRVEFNSKKPFRYITIENFINSDYAEKILAEFPLITDKWKDARGHNTQNKWALPIIKDKIASDFMKEAKSNEFLNYLSKLTSIPDLIFDSDLSGAGYHQSTDGGFLNVHVDFNKLETGNSILDRRLNLIVYFNKNWVQDNGGFLELWDMDKKLLIENISPSFNRCVIFETNEISFHGHPKPLKIGLDETRKSLSIYYYTKGRDDIERIDSHNTIYTNTESILGFLKTFNNGIKHFYRKISKVFNRF